MTTPKILIVDDRKENLVALDHLLKAVDCNVFKALSANEALALTLDHEFALILTDIHMPEMDGYEMVRLLRGEDKTRFIPIIFLTAAYTADEDRFKGYELGAVDFILKPLDEFILLQKVKVFLALYNQRIQLEKEIKSRKKLQKIIKLDHEYPEIIGNSPAMSEMFKMMNVVVGTDVTVFVQGESGTGKELVAKAIHEKSHRKDGPFIRFNCAALPETLIESELFGHEKGAFTGADDVKVGRFELADKGTLFLDELGELSLAAQVKLLRVLQEKEFERVGGTKTLKTDVRIIAATNRDLEKMIREDQFREDLYYRINAFPIVIPPLRNRDADIISLADYFINKYSKEYKKEVKGLSREAKDLLLTYEWKGNVRELQNIISRAVLLCEGDDITGKQLPFASSNSSELSGLISTPGDKILTEDQLTSLYAKSIYKKLNQNKKETAEVLGITFKTLQKRLLD